MGSCSSQEPPSPAHGSRKLTSCDTRTDRSSNFADARSSQPSTSAAVMVPVINAASTKSSSVGQSYARFDRAHATKSQQRYFEAFSRSKASSSRRATLANLAAIKEGDVLALSDADVNSILFAHVGEGIHELDDIFRSAQTGETTHPPGEVAAADAPTLTELNSEGILRLGALLSDSPQDETTLLFLYLLGCREGPWLLKFETWQVGCAALCIVNRSTAVKAYANCVDLYGKMRLSDTQFFEFYKFLFDFVKPPSVRSLSVDDAVTLWEAVLVPRWAGGAAWCAFIKDHPMAKRGIFKDLWSQIVVFATLMTWPSCPEADMDTAWPSLIDSFVDECRHPKKRDSMDADAATTV